MKKWKIVYIRGNDRLTINFESETMKQAMFCFYINYPNCDIVSISLAEYQEE